MTSNTNQHQKPFVANQVIEITESFPTTTWKYVPTPNNPANLLTRGIHICSKVKIFSTMGLWSSLADF